MLFLLGVTLATIAAAELARGAGKGSNTARIKEVFEACNYKNRNDKYPVKVNKSDRHIIYELPAGRCPEEFEALQPYINSYLKCETDIWVDNGQVHVKVMADRLPDILHYSDKAPPEKDSEGKKIEWVLPIPVGQTRDGFLWADLAKLPHICVAGETYGGKSTWIMGALNSLAKLPYVQLYIYDLKQVDYAFMDDYSQQALTLPDSVRMTDDIVLLMMERMKLFRWAKTPNIKRYNALMRSQGKNELPYIVVVIDELTQLSPVLARDKDMKKMCTQVTQNLVDVLCLARAIGIHCIVSTQRPDHEVLHPQMKANMPAAICFKTKNRSNSKIVLDNDKADRLPRIRGRAIWQFDVEREIQVEYLDDIMVMDMLPKVARTKPVHLQVTADGSM